MKDDEFRSVLQTSGSTKKDSRRTLYTKDVPGVLQGRVKFRRKWDVMFFPEQKNSM